MADVDTDQHGALVVHGVWELHLVEVTADLAVDLTQDIGGLGQVEAHGIADRDDLRGDLVHHARIFDLFVVGLAIQNADYNLWVAER